MILRILKPSPRAFLPRTVFSFTAVRRISSIPKIVQLSPEEKEAESLSWKSLELATRALHHDGLAILEDIISHDKLDFLNEKMVHDALLLQSAGDASPFNYNKGFVYVIRPKMYANE